MLNRRNVLILSFSLLNALLLFQFQNCAPANLPAAQASNGDGDVRIIDEFNKSEIQFPTDETEIHDEAISANLDGLCSRRHSGAKLRWALHGDHSDGHPLLTGESSCQSGQFFVEMLNLNDVECGVHHLLVVEGEWGGMAVTRFTKRCEPLASEPIDVPGDSPLGTVCTLEYQPVSSLSSCLKVCYRESKVVFHESVDSKMCSGLMQKLASP